MGGRGRAGAAVPIVRVENAARPRFACTVDPTSHRGRRRWYGKANEWVE